MQYPAEGTELRPAVGTTSLNFVSANGKLKFTVQWQMTMYT